MQPSLFQLPSTCSHVVRGCRCPKSGPHPSPTVVLIAFSALGCTQGPPSTMAGSPGRGRECFAGHGRAPALQLWGSVSSETAWEGQGRETPTLGWPCPGKEYDLSSHYLRCLQAAPTPKRTPVLCFLTFRCSPPSAPSGIILSRAPCQVLSVSATKRFSLSGAHCQVLAAGRARIGSG